MILLCFATAVADKKVKEGIDFFPLTVDYQKRLIWERYTGIFREKANLLKRRY